MHKFKFYSLNVNLSCFPDIVIQSVLRRVFKNLQKIKKITKNTSKLLSKQKNEEKQGKNFP